MHGVCVAAGDAIMAIDGEECHQLTTQVSSAKCCVQRYFLNEFSLARSRFSLPASFSPPPFPPSLFPSLPPSLSPSPPPSPPPPPPIPFSPLPLQEVAKRLRGEVASKVKLTLFRRMHADGDEGYDAEESPPPPPRPGGRPPLGASARGVCVCVL